jgi:hypothetical protein
MPAAIPAVIGAAGAIGGSLISSNASSSAVDAQVNASNNATNAQLQMYNQTRADQSPWRTSGSQALSALDAWYGLPGFQSGSDNSSLKANPITSSGNTTGGGLSGLLNGSVIGMIDGKLPINAKTLVDPQQVFMKPELNSSTPDISGQGGVVSNQGGQMTADQQKQYMQQTIQNQPGYQFQMDQGSQALQRSMAAKGLLNSGAAAKALTQYGQGYASSAANDYLNGLRSMAGLGQTSVQATGVAGMNTANQIGQNSIYAGNAQASGYANQANSINSGLGGLTNAFQNYWNNGGTGNGGQYNVGGQGNGGSGYSYNYNDTPTIGGYVTPGG